MSARVFRVATTALFLGLFGAACGDPVRVSAPAEASATGSSALPGTVAGEVAEATRLFCPTEVARSASAVIGPEGGSLAVEGVRVDFPVGAVKSAETFALKVVAGSYVDVDLSANGYTHYTFAKPVAVSLDLTRCGELPSGLRAWYMDSDTKALLENMGGELDLIKKSLRFTTPHFSGYTVAW